MTPRSTGTATDSTIRAKISQENLLPTTAWSTLNNPPSKDKLVRIVPVSVFCTAFLAVEPTETPWDSQTGASAQSLCLFIYTAGRMNCLNVHGGQRQIPLSSDSHIEGAVRTGAVTIGR
jgi:hypothetical protein